MFFTVYVFIYYVVIALVGVLVGALLLRLIFSFADPNPFGAPGRFAFKLRKITERFVYPAERLLMRFRIDARYAPLITILVTAIFAYFGLGIVENTLFIVQGMTKSIADGDIKTFVGFMFYAALSLYILFVFIRFLSSWFVFTKNTFLGFVRRATDPVLLPVQRLIPPVGMFDLSGMIVLLLLDFARSLVFRMFLT